MKKYAGYKHVFSGPLNSGRHVYVANDIFDTYQKIASEYRGNYDMTTIMRHIFLLNADPLRGKSLNPAGDERTLTSGAITMKYNLFNGAVFIQVLAINCKYIPSRTALYELNYNTETYQWESGEEPLSSFDAKKTWASKSHSAHYAAVAGKFDNKDAAAAMLPKHIISAYQKADYIISDDANDACSMFWIENGQHGKHATAQALASIMQQSTENGLPVNWLVHGDGVKAFKNAAKILKTSPLANAVDRQTNPAAGQIHNQNVYFSNPTNASEKSLQALCADAGLNYVGLNTHNRDLRQWRTLGNACAEMGKTVLLGALAGGGTVTATDTALKTAGAGGADKIANTAMEAVLSGNYAMLAGCTIAVGIMGHAVWKKSKVVRAGIRCTFGSGNQQWYTGDSDLLA